MIIIDPFLISSLFFLIFSKFLTLILIPILLLSLFSNSLVSSNGTTASEPDGIGAPVMILEACPVDRDNLGIDPAGISSITSRYIIFSSSAFIKSSLITAYPSIAELSKGGTLISEIISSETILPTESKILI